MSEMDMVGFCQGVFPQLKMMEVGLKSFGENLTELTFSGGASFKSVIKSVINGMEHLRQLEKFTLKHDCTAGVSTFLVKL